MEQPPVHLPRRRRLLGRISLGVAIFLGLVYLAISLISAEVLTRSHNRASIVDPRDVSPNPTPWKVRTEDGFTLRGWYHPTEEHRRLVVMVHGLWSSWGEMAGLGRDLHERGYDILLFDLRGHGQSDRSRVSMGRRERCDLRAVLNWAEAQGFSTDRIGWVGFSMGASTLLMEAAQNSRIKTVVLDSPYGNLPELLDGQLTQHSHLPRWFNPGILVAAHLAYGVRTDDLIPIRSAKAWGDRPLLLIHGEADTTVPVRQARLLANAAGPTCRTVLLPGIDHVKAYESDPLSYVSAVDSFFQRHLTR